MRLMRTWRFSVLAVLCASMAAPVEAFQCPVLIQNAETALNAAKTSMTDPRARSFLEEATALLKYAKVKHQEAKGADDHNRAMAKARIAQAAAELARAPGK